MNHSEYLDLETTFEDLNKMLYYEEILDLTKIIMYHPSIYNVKVCSIQLIKNAELIKNINSIFRKIYQEEQFTKYFKTAKMILLRDNITNMYLCIKAELIHMKSELAKLNSKYGSIENLQNMINKEISNPDNISSNEKLPLAIPVYNYDLSKNLYSKMLT